MAIINPAKRILRHGAARIAGPPTVFAIAVLATFAVLAIAAATQPRDIVLPLLSTLLFVMAALVALLAWTHRRAFGQDQVTYWDVAGALTLIGICAAATIEPDQMVRFLQSDRTQN